MLVENLVINDKTEDNEINSEFCKFPKTRDDALYRKNKQNAPFNTLKIKIYIIT